jgi:uncharacterized protein YndB with AHSA1/START domain
MSTATTAPAEPGVSGDLTTVQRIQLAIRATPEEIWRALTDGSVTPDYYVGFKAEFDLTPGATYRYTAGGGDVITGRVLDVEPARRLTTTFNGHWDTEVAKLPESTVTFSLTDPAMPMPGVTVLTCAHTGLPDTPVATGLESGWVAILSGLKTLLETGEPMVAA